MTDAPYITADQAGTLSGLFAERVRRTPDRPAYRQCDPATGAWFDTSWHEMATQVEHVLATLAKEGLAAGERVAIMVRNSREWVVVDVAALSLGLVTVPIFIRDRADNAKHVMADSGARLLFVGGDKEWRRLDNAMDDVTTVRRIISFQPITDAGDDRVTTFADWLTTDMPQAVSADIAPDDLATIFYTSGTTGQPKGVMLTHRNILENASRCLQRVSVFADDLFLSFLPLSHTLERTVGLCLPMMAGAPVAFTRSITMLAEDMAAVRPTALIAVPLFFERVHHTTLEVVDEKGVVARLLFRLAVASGWSQFERQQRRRGWRPSQLAAPALRRFVGRGLAKRLGGRLRVAVSGGAALPGDTAKLFLGLGLNVIQGYGLTEASPVVSLNSVEDNEPASVGRVIDGLETRISEDQELQVRGPTVMRGYWNDDAATLEAMTEDGWLKTGDQARMTDGRLYIIGRLKEVLVLANGEKVPPDDVESAIVSDPWFAQALLIGNDRPHLAALVVLSEAAWEKAARALGFPLDPAQVDRDEPALEAIIKRLNGCLKRFPGYVHIRGAAVCPEPWTVDNNLLTATHKKRKKQITETFAERIELMYADMG